MKILIIHSIIPSVELGPSSEGVGTDLLLKEIIITDFEANKIMLHKMIYEGIYMFILSQKFTSKRGIKVDKYF